MTICWIITEGLKGTENQCIALADALGLNPVIKTVQLKQPWKTILPWLPGFSPRALAAGSSHFKAPWPDLIIASGRKAIAPALWVKKQSGGKAKLIIVQNPVIRHRDFDLVVMPKHDRYRERNVVTITGALSLLTPEKLAVAKEEWGNVLSALPAPRIAVLVGGNSRAHRMTPEIVDRLIAQLRVLQGKGYSLMITASRRTPNEMAQHLRNALLSSSAPSPASQASATPLTRGEVECVAFRGEGNATNTHFYDNSGSNPYAGYLAWADSILVTEDSVSMASEAISTGKPVYIIPMVGGSKRIRRFHDDIVQCGYARWFEGRIEDWSYTPPDNFGNDKLTALASCYDP